MADKKGLQHAMCCNLFWGVVYLLLQKLFAKLGHLLRAIGIYNLLDVYTLKRNVAFYTSEVVVAHACHCLFAIQFNNFRCAIGYINSD